MAGSILGKRSRSDLNEGPAVSTRSKRQSLRSSTHNDENQPPAQLSEDDEIHVSTTRKARKQPSKHTVPAKHGAPERHINASPIRINGHFKETKPPVQLYAEGKDARTPRTPSTPRHRDALAKKIPVTPKHRVLLNNSPSARAFTSPSSASTSVYNSARRLFSRCCNPGKLVGRDAERAEISAFVEKCTESRTGGCLYVSGPPGTGKSALIAEICASFSQSRQSVVNCMSVRTIKDLSQKLSDDLSLPEGEGLEHLRSCFSAVGQTKEQYLVILDEVDRLLELDLELFYRIFEWSMTPESNLILLGIANALDLTDRFLPQLKARGLKPELLPFLPYSAKQIADILTTKLKTLTTADSPDLPFLHPAAIQFCARKVASQTGDLRKAFDICRRAIDLVEQEAREKAIEESLQVSPTKTPLMENINLSSPVTPRASPHKARHVVRYTVDNAPKVTIAHVAKVTAQAFGNGALQRLATLNLQQKAVLCALAALEKKRRETQIERDIYSTPSKADVNHSAPTIKHLFEAYSSLCKRDQILHPLTSVEFRDVVSGLETSSLVSPADAKNGTLGAMPPTPSRTPGRRSKMANFGGTSAGSDERRVASVVSYKELSDSLDGAGSDLLRSILDGHGLSM